ncbi:FliG C-terminal domain-containing protein [Archangium lansingense]|uniref:FliG C-terminal domain-containing protein n=1 Tax=Archangium lansingense TaxID=2995310 RepID=UPI003B794050
MIRLSRHLLIALGCLVCTAALANPATPQARLRADAEERSRAEVTDLLRTLCPEQCVLVSVEARVEEESVGGGTPGFETLSGGATLPTLRSVTARVLVDSRLPGPFRTRLKDLVAQRLKTVGPQPAVEVESVAFPPRNAPHLEAPPLDQKPQQPSATPPTSEAEQGTKEVLPMAERLQERLLEAAPLLVLALLLMLTVLVLGVLLVIAARRPPAPAPLDYAMPEEPPLAQEPTPSAAAPTTEYPAVRARRLERTLREERAVRNAVVREALARGELRQVAIWTREMGEFLLDDLRGDSTLGTSLSGLAAELGRVPAGDAGSRATALYDLEGRSIAARLAQAEDSVEAAFAFLEGVRPERFAAACQSLSAGAREVALRFAPASLRAVALQALTPSQRAELALGLARQPELSSRYALAVADELRTQLTETAGGASQLERVLGEVLDTLPMEEQDRLIERLRHEGSERLVSSLVTESSLVSAPVEVLGAALLRLPPAQLVTYLNGAERSLRERLLTACPTSMQRELQEELGMRGAERPEAFIGARKELLASLKDEMFRRGLTTMQNRAQAGRAN